MVRGVQIDLPAVGQANSGSADTFMIKEPPLVSDYGPLCERFHGARIVELGIFNGGSTMLVGLLAQPECLVAIDLNEVNPELPDALIEQGLDNCVRLHYGVDQSDGEALRQIIDAELGGEPIDLVIDDASHLYLETRASFDALFPLIRPGGLYVVEDWNAERRFADLLAKGDPIGSRPHFERMVDNVRERRSSGTIPEQPLLRLALELTLASASMYSPVGNVTTTRYWVSVERSDQPVVAEGFRLADLLLDGYGLLSAEGPGRVAR